ncbi:MAG TPA: hypothetical protein VFM58_13755 [Solirubrobacteraceae bacterium]|nr:hypothetical protein [Solirubrobacteraceae bacterium]
MTIALAAYTLVALFWDGLHHNNITGEDQFFSPPHIAMYLGLIAVGVWIALVMLRYQRGLYHLEWSAVPLGYGFAIIALPLAAIAGPADFMWHQAYGFENQIDSTFSPSHQGLFYSGAMLATIAGAAAWQRRDVVTPTLREHLPAAFSVTSLLAVMLFIVHQIVPFYGGGVAATQAFQDDIASRPDAFAPGSGAEHAEGLARALTHYGDAAFPYYFYSTHASVAGILIFTAALIGMVLVMRRRWRIPFGTLTITFTFLALLWAMLSEYRQAELIPSLVLAGVVGDVLLGRLGGGRIGHIRLFAALVPPVLWSLFFLCIALFQGGLGWEPTLWFGLLVTTSALGYAMSLLVFPPYSAPWQEGKAA